MDNGLVQHVSAINSDNNLVLILIVVDNGLVQSNNIKVLANSSMS